MNTKEKDSYTTMCTINEYSSKSQLNDNKFYGKIGKLIKIVDDLRDLGLNEVFELPKICVLGTQSSGKSSVLESIIGLDCLPRGSGLVTRRPLELRLCHLHYSDTQPAYAEFEELKGQKFTDFEKVKQMINDLTDKVAGKKGNIVNIPIKLRIHSKTCPDLTVIDLPGITRIPLHGSDQPKDIEQITRDMCQKYCQDKTTIILCVMQANIDISTSEALHMAMTLDPTGDRTIGVLTKLDLMDSGTNAKNLLENSEIPLKNGYVALKNRSQQDLMDKIPIQDAIQKEMLFFKSHLIYSKMSNNYFGIETLVDKLKMLFFDHLKLYLPGIYTNIKDKISECKKCLEALGSDYMVIMNNHGSQLNYLNQLVNKFSENYENIFKGKSLDLEENTTSHSIKRNYFDFLENLNYNPSEKIHKTYITEMLMRSEGDRLSGFPEVNVVYDILNTEYDLIKSDVNSFYESIYEIVVKTSHLLLEKYFKRFPPLKAKITEIVMEFVDSSFAKTKYICNSIVKMNMEYLYVDEKGQFESFLKEILGVNQINEEIDNNNNANNSGNTNNNSLQNSRQGSNSNKLFHNNYQRSETEISELYFDKIADYVKKIVDYYYKLVIRNLRESVPKSMAYYFILNLKNIRSHILFQIAQTQDLESYLNEDPMVVSKRKYHYDILKILEKSEKLMTSDEDIRKIIYIKRDNKDNQEVKKLEDMYRITQDVNKQKSFNEKSHKINSSNMFSNNVTSGSNPSNSFNNSTSTSTNYNLNSNESKIKNNYDNANKTSNNYSNNNVNSNNISNTNNTNNNNNGPNIKLGFSSNKNTGEPEINAEVKMSVQDAKKLYEQNKQYMPSKDQIIQGAKATNNFVQEQNKTSKNADPLTKLFGKK